VKGSSVDKIRILEKKAKDLGLDERILIENASANLLSAIEDLLLEKKVVVVAGRGNNGADVLSCARKLFNKGYDVSVAVLLEKELGQEALFQKNILEKLKIPIKFFNKDNLSKLTDLLKACDFILEGILGIGVKGDISPFLEETIILINKSGKKIISCDVPSGLSPDDGIVLGQAIKADYTITFVDSKKGFFLNQGPELCGQIFVVDIGVTREILQELLKESS